MCRQLLCLRRTMLDQGLCGTEAPSHMREHLQLRSQRRYCNRYTLRYTVSGKNLISHYLAGPASWTATHMQRETKATGCGTMSTIAGQSYIDYAGSNQRLPEIYPQSAWYPVSALCHFLILSAHWLFGCRKGGCTRWTHASIQYYSRSSILWEYRGYVNILSTWWMMWRS